MAIMTGIAWTSPVIRSGSEGESQGRRRSRDGGTGTNERTNPFPTLPFFSRRLSLSFLLLRGKERARKRQRVHYFCNEDHLGNDFFGLINELPTFSAKRRGTAGRAGRHALGRTGGGGEEELLESFRKKRPFLPTGCSVIRRHRFTVSEVVNQNRYPRIEAISLAFLTLLGGSLDTNGPSKYKQSRQTSFPKQS